LKVTQASSDMVRQITSFSTASPAKNSASRRVRIIQPGRVSGTVPSSTNCR
jgi:hypothetical protein